jgi:hypothetical protein
MAAIKGVPTNAAHRLVQHHDALLFQLAYPKSRKLFAEAERELAAAAEAARALGARRTRETGVAWSETTCAFGYSVARWLAHEHSTSAEIDDAGLDAEHMKRVLRFSLPPIEYEVAGEHRQTLAAFFEEAKGAGRATNLAWTIAQFERLPCGARIREHLFEALELPICLSPRNGPLSRTFARGLPVPIFVHSGPFKRAFDLQRLMGKPLPPQRTLARAERSHLIGAARGILAMLGRETDVISLANEAGVESFDLERGFSIALYAMPPERRFPLDTHVGFMLFKNTIPLAYGGGWPFLGTCRIGINVFAPFRGGESSYAFGQVLRVYAQRFRAERFLVEPYQIGEGNPDGVKSGAFWFYYRLGFRPLGARHAELARDEFARIAAQRGYRAPLAVMRRLSHADLELRVRGAARAAGVWPEPAQLSLAVSTWIAREFGGDRSAAQSAACERVAKALVIENLGAWTPPQRAAFESLSLLLAMIPGLAAWPAKERRDCVAVIRAKGSQDESEFARVATAHRMLREALGAIASERV